MTRRRARNADIATKIGCHTFPRHRHQRLIGPRSKLRRWDSRRAARWDTRSILPRTRGLPDTDEVDI